MPRVAVWTAINAHAAGPVSVEIESPGDVPLVVHAVLVVQPETLGHRPSGHVAELVGLVVVLKRLTSVIRPAAVALWPADVAFRPLDIASGSVGVAFRPLAVAFGSVGVASRRSIVSGR